MTFALDRSERLRVGSMEHPVSERFWRAAREETPALPIDIYRILGGTLLLVRAGQSLFHHHGDMPRAIAWLAAAVCASFVLAGVRPRISALVFLAILTSASRESSVRSLEDYLLASTVFWLACLPTGEALCLRSRHTPRAHSSAPHVAGLARRVFVVWITLVLWCGGLWDLAWGRFLPPPVDRALAGMLLAFLVWPANSPARLLAAGLFASLAVGLFIRLGPSLGMFSFLAAGLVVWSPEIARRLGVSAARPEKRGRIGAGDVGAAVMLFLFVLTLFPASIDSAAKSGAILTDLGLLPSLVSASEEGAVRTSTVVPSPERLRGPE